jgi:hypothetical protein
MENIDIKTVEGFGREWASFDQSGLSDEEKFCARIFTRRQIELMLEHAGFKDVHFSDKAPYWCAVAAKG